MFLYHETARSKKEMATDPKFILANANLFVSHATGSFYQFVTFSSNLTFAVVYLRKLLKYTYHSISV